MSREATRPANDRNLFKVAVGFFVMVLIVAAVGFAIQLLLGSAKTTKAATPRPSIAASYSALVIPGSLKLSEHQSMSSGTPSEVYFYTISGDTLMASNQFAANLTNAGYSSNTGTDGLLFSASMAGKISLNFTFSEPNQLKVVAI